MSRLADSIRDTNNPANLRKPAFNIINRVQDFTAGEQVVGMAVALIAICETTNTDLSEVLTRAGRIIRDVDGPFTHHVRAIREYAANEFGDNATR